MPPGDEEPRASEGWVPRLCAEPQRCWEQRLSPRCPVTAATNSLFRLNNSEWVFIAWNQDLCQPTGIGGTTHRSCPRLI